MMLHMALSQIWAQLIIGQDSLSIYRPIIRGHFLHQIQSIQCYLLSPIKNHALHVFIRQKGTVDVIYTPIFWFLGKKTLSIFFVQSLDRFQTKVLIF